MANSRQSMKSKNTPKNKLNVTKKPKTLPKPKNVKVKSPTSVKKQTQTAIASNEGLNQLLGTINEIVIENKPLLMKFIKNMLSTDIFSKDESDKEKNENLHHVARTNKNMSHKKTHEENEIESMDDEHDADESTEEASERS
jgi:hypothetical protein